MYIQLKMLVHQIFIFQHGFITWVQCTSINEEINAGFVLQHEVVGSQLILVFWYYFPESVLDELATNESSGVCVFR